MEAQGWDKVRWNLGRNKLSSCSPQNNIIVFLGYRWKWLLPRALNGERGKVTKSSLSFSVTHNLSQFTSDTRIEGAMVGTDFSSYQNFESPKRDIFGSARRGHFQRDLHSGGCYHHDHTTRQKHRRIDILWLMVPNQLERVV